MATKISAMTAASTLDGTESIELVQGANSRKVVLDTALSDLNVVQQDAVTGALEVGGVAINPSAVYDTWTEVQAIPKTAANDGLIVICKDVGVGGSTWRYSHANTRWYVYGRCFLANNASDVTHGATLTTVEAMATTRIMNDGTKSILQNGDSLRVMYTIIKTGTADGIRSATKVHTATGTGGTDVKVTAGAAVGTICLKESFELKRISTTSMRNLASAAVVAGDAVQGTTTFLADVTVSNFDTTAEIWLNSTFYASASTGDTAMICQDYTVELITRGA